MVEQNKSPPELPLRGEPEPLREPMKSSRLTTRIGFALILGAGGLSYILQQRDPPNYRELEKRFSTNNWDRNHNKDQLVQQPETGTSALTKQDLNQFVTKQDLNQLRDEIREMMKQILSSQSPPRPSPQAALPPPLQVK